MAVPTLLYMLRIITRLFFIKRTNLYFFINLTIIIDNWRDTITYIHKGRKRGKRGQSSQSVFPQWNERELVGSRSKVFRLESILFASSFTPALFYSSSIHFSSFPCLVPFILQRKEVKKSNLRSLNRSTETSRWYRSRGFFIK